LGTIAYRRPFSRVEDWPVNEMSPETKRAVGRQLSLAALLFAAGLTMVGFSLAQLHAQNETQLAQGTGEPGRPLQATPSPQPASPPPPAEAEPGGQRPTMPAPEPARPDANAQKDGARPALPPAPPEKMAPPIQDKK
jgi:hypothetical protein